MSKTFWRICIALGMFAGGVALGGHLAQQQVPLQVQMAAPAKINLPVVAPKPQPDRSYVLIMPVSDGKHTAYMVGKGGFTLAEAQHAAQVQWQDQDLRETMRQHDEQIAAQAYAQGRASVATSSTVSK